MSGTPENPVLGTSHRVWQLAWPTIVSNLLLTTVQFSHIKIVSGLGTSSVAAVTTGHRVFFLVQAMMMGLSVATTAVISRNWGANRRYAAEMGAWTSMALCIALSGAIMLPLVLFPHGVAAGFGLDEETTHQTAEFILWYGLFSVFMSINLILSTALRATGDVVTPLWFLLANVVLNALLAYLLAYGVFGLPKLGVAGAGLGGGLAAGITALLFVLRWWRGKFSLAAVKRWHIDRVITWQLIRIGTPAVIEQGFIQFAMLAFFLILGHYGTAAYAAYGIGISIVSFSLVVAFGFGIATATLVGQQLGAGDPEGAMAAGWRGLRMAIAAMVVLSALLAIYAEELAAFMIPDPETAHLTAIFIYVIAASQPIMAVEITLSGALRGAGDTRFPLISTITGMFLGRLLPALVFVELGAPIAWIFSVTLIEYAIKAGLMLHRYRAGRWLHLKLSS